MTPAQLDALVKASQPKASLPQGDGASLKMLASMPLAG